MASHHANMSCILKVEPKCDACKRQTLQVLSSLDGVYDVMIDAKTKTAKVWGEVDPNYCLKALMRCGMHAEIVQANLTHPRLAAAGAYDPYHGSHGRSPYGYDHYAPQYHGNSYPYPYPYRRLFSQGMLHEYPVRTALPDYHYSRSYYYYDGPTVYRGRGDYNPYAL